LNYRKTIVIIGGGAAGFFAAIHAAEKQPSAQILIFEKNRQVLGKVKVSGGGRCNITHACFDPYELIHHYPRGGKELLGAFTRFGVTDTINWFRQKGVYLKTEHDGRMFPVTDSAQTVIDCFLRYAKKYGIKIFKEEAVISLKLVENHWHVKTSKGNIIIADSVLATSGSSNGMWNVLRDLGHTIVPPVPSLFTFDVSDWRIKNLQGIAVPDAIVQIKQIPYQQQGSLLEIIGFCSTRFTPHELRF
jgi:predicted Rossmann fold flavoprotein